MAVYSSINLATTTSISSAVTIELGSVVDENPSGSANPISIDTSNDDFTVDETADWLFSVFGTFSKTSGTATDSTYIELSLQTDAGAGNWSSPVTVGTVRSFVKDGSCSASLTLAADSTSGWMYRLRASASAATYSLISGGRMTIWRDDTSSQAPNDASYLVAASNGTLTDERVATSGEGVGVLSTSSAGTAVFNLDFPGLTTYTGAGSSDFVCVYDNTAKEHKKMTWSELFLVRDVQHATVSSLAAMGAPPETLIGLAEHIDANITPASLSGDRAADAVTILEHYRDNGTNSGIASPAGQRAILQAILKINRYQAFEAGTD